MDISNILRQHQEVLDLLESIGGYQGEETVREKAAEIAKRLAQLSGIINLHLAAEDKFVYPALRRHADEKIRNTAADFAAEMGELGQVFTTFKRDFLVPSKISAAPAGFIAASQQVFAALRARIKKEDMLLYPLLK